MVQPLVVVADVTQLDAIEQMVGQIESTFGRLDVVVNNAAKGGGSEEESVEEFEDYFRANTRSVYALCTRAKPLLEKSGGAIVNISSINGLKPVNSRLNQYMTIMGNSYSFQMSVTACPKRHSICLPDVWHRTGDRSASESMASSKC